MVATTSSMEDEINPRVTIQTCDATKSPNGTQIKARKKKKKPLFVSSSNKGVRVSNTRPRISTGSSNRRESDVEAIALPLGMSIAAVVSQVLENKGVGKEKMSSECLSEICALAVQEALTNVFGDKFDCFVSNFEKSFRSTLRTLRLINKVSMIEEGFQPSNSNTEMSILLARTTTSDNYIDRPPMSDCAKNSELRSRSFRMKDNSSTAEWVESSMQTTTINRELVVHGQIGRQLSCVGPDRQDSCISHAVLSTFEKSVLELTRANDLKQVEIELALKNLELKETKLVLDSDSNLLERLKLSMGISKASFKAEKFKSQLEDARHAELLRSCIDCLVGGLFIMSASLLYGTYVHSYKRIVEATSSCSPSQESKSWWMPNPVATFNSGLRTLACHVQVASRLLFGVFMILAIAYLLIQRTDASKQTMPISFILMLLGIACGFAGKLCVDTLGGSGYNWLLYWEALCLLHFFACVCTPTLFAFLYGPINVCKGSNDIVMFPYWTRRFLFYTFLIFLLPVSCGLMPFASIGEWKNHLLSCAKSLLFVQEYDYSEPMSGHSATY